MIRASYDTLDCIQKAFITFIGSLYTSHTHEKTYNTYIEYNE